MMLQTSMKIALGILQTSIKIALGIPLSKMLLEALF